MTALRHATLALAALLALGLGAAGAQAAFVQQGPKVVPSDVWEGARFGVDVALSADGQTALVAGNYETISPGAVWTLRRGANGRWVEQGPPLVPAAIDAASSFGLSVVLSADGDTALVGGQLSGGVVAFWTFTRTGGVWSQQGLPLTPADAVSPGTVVDRVGLSADGRTALLVGDASDGGVAWVYARQGGAWVQQGTDLSVSGARAGSFGVDVALAGDGDAALVETASSSESGLEVWAFERSGGAWVQDGSQLHADDGTIGDTLALDASGTTALLTGPAADGAGGAMWAFDRTAAGWAQAGPRTLVPDGGGFDYSAALSSDGSYALVGSEQNDLIGSAWLLQRAAAGWDEVAELRPSDALENVTPSSAVEFGASVALTPDAQTLLVGGPGDNDAGAVWTFMPALHALAIPRLRAFAGTTIPPGPVPVSVVLDRGSAPTGTMTFSLYDTLCSGQPVQTEVVPVNGNGTYAAHSLVAGALGGYGVIATYSGDTRNAPASIGCRDLFFEVADAAQLGVAVHGTQEVGAPLTIVPALTGGLFSPSGDVTVSVYGASDPLCAKPPVFTRQVTVQFDRRIPVSIYTPDAAGRLTVTAFYGGDSENPPVTIGCGEVTVPVARASPAIAAAASSPTAVGGAIGAAARVAGFHAGGTISFYLYGPGDPTCAGRPLATVDAPLSDGVAQSEAFATSVTGTYHLTASYPGDRENRGVASACDAASVTVGRAQPKLVAMASTGTGASVVDTAQLQGAFRPTGNVRFALYGRRDPHCRRRAVLTELAPLDGDRATTGPLYDAAPGRYEFVVSYAGDAANAASQTACGANSVRVSAPAHRRSARRARRPRRPRRRRRR